MLGPRSVSAIEARTLPPYQPRALSAHTGIKSWPTGSQMSCMNFGQGSAHTPITHSQGLPTRLSRAHCLGSHAGSGTPSLPRGRAGGVHTCSAPCWPPRQPAPLCGEQAWEDKQGETGRGTLAARTRRYPFCPTGCSRSPPPPRRLLPHGWSQTGSSGHGRLFQRPPACPAVLLCIPPCLLDTGAQPS